MDPSVLALVNRDDADGGVRAHAASMLRDIALEAFEETGESDSLAAVSALSDPKILSQIAKTATRASVAERALGRVDDPRSRGSIARHAVLESIRLAACASLTDREELVAVAMNSGFKDTAVAAVDRLTDRADLAHVAERSNNKNAAKRARVDPPRNGRAAERACRRGSAVARSRRGAAIRRCRRLTSRRLRRLSLDGPLQQADEPAVDEAEAEIARQQAERQAAELVAAQEAASEQARKEAERRHERLAELVVEIEAAVGDEDLRSAKRRHVLAQREWRDLTASMESPDEALTQRYAAAELRLTTRDQEAKEADRRARREALVQITELLDRVEALAANDDVTSKAAERGLRDVRGALGHVPPLPSKQEYDDVMRRLKAAQTALTSKLQSAARDRRLAALGQRRHPGAAVRENGSAQV